MPTTLVLTDVQHLDVVVARRVSEPSPWAALSGLAERIIGALPIHRDSASGRRNANQARLVMLGSGVLVVVLWQSPWAPVALLLCLASLVLPMSESRRRQLTAKLRANRRRTRVTHTPGDLEVGPTHITLTCDDETLRRLGRKNLQIARTDDQLELRTSAKKRDRILVAEEALDEEMWVEGDRDAIRGALER